MIRLELPPKYIVYLLFHHNICQFYQPWRNLIKVFVHKTKKFQSWIVVNKKLNSGRYNELIVDVYGGGDQTLKLIFYKNNTNPPIVTQNLHDPAPIFQANTHQNMGQNRVDFVRITQIRLLSNKICTIRLRILVRVCLKYEGRIVQILCDNRRLCIILIKNGL